MRRKRDRSASILAATEAATIMETQFDAQARHDYLERLRAADLDTEQKRKELFDACAAELSMKRREWPNIQVCLVAAERTETCKTWPLFGQHAANSKASPDIGKVSGLSAS